MSYNLEWKLKYYISLYKDHFPKLFDTTQNVKYFKRKSQEGSKLKTYLPNLLWKRRYCLKLLKDVWKETRIFWKPSIRTVSISAFIYMTLQNWDVVLLRWTQFVTGPFSKNLFIKDKCQVTKKSNSTFSKCLKLNFWFIFIITKDAVVLFLSACKILSKEITFRNSNSNIDSNT